MVSRWRAIGCGDALVIGLADGRELRYHDAADMGKIYLVRDLAQVPTYGEQGRRRMTPALTLEIFRQRLRKHPGEIKSTLTNQAFVAGIGNAYADEICWCACALSVPPLRQLSRG